MMDNAVKERLVGAAVLVLLVVIVVPALLRGPRTQAPPAPPEGEQPMVPAGDLRVVEIDLAGAQPAASAEPMPAATEETVAAAPAPAPEQEGASGPAGASGTAATPAAEPPSAAQATPAAPGAGAGWAAQVAALSSQEAALKLVAELKGKGYPAFVLEHRAGGKVLYRVRVGPEAQRDRADALAERLRAEGLEPAVVAHP